MVAAPAAEPAGGRGSLPFLASNAWPAPAAVLALAAAVRLWRIDLARFADDQATLLQSAVHALAARELPLTTGMSFTIGVRHPPLATLLLLPAAAISRDPVWVSAYVACLDALAALLVYLVGVRLAGRPIGLVACGLYALQPAAVVYGRTIWNPHLVPLCAAAALWCLVVYWQSGSGWAQAGALLAIGCAAQLHLLAVALIVVWLAATAARGKLHWQVALAAAALAVLLAPYVYLQTISAWSDVRAALAYLQQPKRFDWQALSALASLFGSRPYTELLRPAGSAPPAFATDPLGWLWASALLAGLARVLIWRRPAELLVAGGLLAPLLLALDHSGDVALHYMLVTLPAGCLLTALALGAVRPPVVGRGLVALALVWPAVAYVRFQRALPEQALGAAYGMPLRYSLEAAGLSQPSGRPVLVANRDEEAGVFSYLLGGVEHKRFDGRYTFVFARAPAVYVADASLPFAFDLLRAAGLPERDVTTSSGRSAYSVFSTSGRDPALPALRPLDVDVDHVLRLTGYDAPDLRAGGPSVVRLAWQITDPHGSVPDDLRQFAHLTDTTGRIWSTNPDFRGFPRPYWEAGDRVLSAFALNLPAGMPAGGYWLETGFYEPISGRRLSQYRDGTPAGTVARIGPLKVRGVSPPGSARPPLAVFGNGQMALLDVRRQAGGISLRWQALRRPEAAYTVFVHVLDDRGLVVSQQDGPPRQGSYPTSLWDPGEVVDDLHPLVIPPSGRQLEIGLYTYPDLHRLPRDGASADSLTLPAPAS